MFIVLECVYCFRNRGAFRSSRVRALSVHLPSLTRRYRSSSSAVIGRVYSPPRSLPPLPAPSLPAPSVPTGVGAPGVVPMPLAGSAVGTGGSSTSMGTLTLDSEFLPMFNAM